MNEEQSIGMFFPCLLNFPDSESRMSRTSAVEELYILSNDVTQILKSKGIGIYRTVVGEYATSMEMAGASISICKMNDELKGYMDHPVKTPFLCQK